MNCGPRLASRSLKMVVLSLSLLMLSSAAIVAVAQQRPNEFRNDIGDPATFGVRAAAPAATADAGFAVATTALYALTAGPRDVSATSDSDKVTSATRAHHRVPLVTDWSTKHVVFSKPRTAKDAARLERDPRYQMQLARRNAPAFRKLADARVDSSDLLDRFRNRVHDPQTRTTKADPIHRDWSVQLNGNGTSAPTPSVGASQFPAKATFDITAPPDCVNDFVVYNTNTSLLVAFNNLYTSPDGTGYCPGTAPNVMWAYNVTTCFAEDGVTPLGVTSTSVTLSFDGSQVAFIESSAMCGSVLHILKWSATDGGTIAVPADAGFQVTRRRKLLGQQLRRSQRRLHVGRAVQ